ncbi:MAG TPA: intradiol ring-cleavage dioxygenase, partial [Thermoanaerobaculia bacterium]
MRSSILVSLIALQIAGVGCAQDVSRPAKLAGGGCDGCELMFEGMPKDLSWRTTVAGEKEAGTPLVVRGVVYQGDGKTPAPGVVLYVYQADSGGRYSPATGQVQGKRHGRLRGRMKTGADGR